MSQASFRLASILACAAASAAFAADFGPTVTNRAPAPGPAPLGMVWIPGGEFSMGAAEVDAALCGIGDPVVDARPVHRVYVDGFWMDRTDVTNAQFARFVAATGYVTIAERKPDPADFPGVPAALLVPGSIVFTPTDHAVPLDDPRRWWRWVPGASWRHPEGPGSSLAGRERYPVVQVAYPDAAAYARWAHKRLPTEAEWEFAARGGLVGKLYAWGDVLNPGGKWLANIWTGRFPYENDAADGYAGLAPVASYPPNGYGLYDMAGNVWQWVSDWYRPDQYAREAAAGAVIRNPRGPSRAESFDPEEPGVPKHVQRGGSFLCTAQYCTRYMVGSRGKGEPSTGGSNVGFRCVRDP